jgi:DNA-directed RNA polymerase subunit alpha
VSVFNKDKVIATVNAGGHMRLTLKISTRIGYDAAVARDDEATTNQKYLAHLKLL